MEYPWLKEYRVCNMPRTLEPYPDVPSHHFLDRAAREYPHLRIVQPGAEITYPEAKERSDRLSCALAAMGIEKGDRVATLLPTSIQFVISDSGISKAGAVHVPGSFLEPPESLARKLNESSAKALICLDTHAAHAAYLEANTRLEHIIVASLDGERRSPPDRTDVPGALAFLEVIEQAAPRPPSVKFEPSRDLESIIFTGGTTGVSKGCMLTHRNVVANSIQNPSGFGRINSVFKGNMSVLLCNPFFHSYGHSIMHTMLNCCFNLLLVTDPRDYRRMLELVRRFNPILQFGVPTQFMKMLQEDASGARVIGVSGSAPLPPKIQERFRETTRGGHLLEGYGLSEMTAVSHFNPSANISAMGGRKRAYFMNRYLFGPTGATVLRGIARVVGPARFGLTFLKTTAFLNRHFRDSRHVRGVEKFASIGIPLPDTRVKVIDVGTGSPLPLDEVVEKGLEGELLLDGPQRMLGYWPEEGSGIDGEGFVHTGDVVRIDGRGYFSIVDRVKDMIIVSGYKVYTREIDDILYQHPATEIAATVGVPDPERPGSERVRVFVQLKEEYRGAVTEDDYMQLLRAGAPRYALPRSIVFLDSIPLTEVYKVDKVALREINTPQ